MISPSAGLLTHVRGIINWGFWVLQHPILLEDLRANTHILQKQQQIITRLNTIQSNMPGRLIRQ